MTNALSTEQNLLRLANRLTELAAWRDLAAVPLTLTSEWSGGTQLHRVVSLKSEP